MGRGSPSLDNLHHENEGFRGNGTSKSEKISFQNANCFGRQNCDDGTECDGSPNCSKCNSINKRKEDQKIYVRGVSSQWNRNRNNDKQDVVRQQPINSNVEGENYTDITMVPFECCPNQERIRSLQLSLGQLRRIGALADNAWTKEKPKTPCRLVVPNVQSTAAKIPESMCHVPKGEKKDESREGRKIPENPFMLVEMIADKKDRKRVGNYLNCYVEGGDPSTLICYMEIVKQYGFDHIILIGQRYAGILFLDCYGRVFEWESMCNVLWSLGDYRNVATKESRTSRLIWGLEFDGTIVEFEDVKDGMSRFYSFSFLF